MEAYVFHDLVLVCLMLCLTLALLCLYLIKLESILCFINCLHTIFLLFVCIIISLFHQGGFIRALKFSLVGEDGALVCLSNICLNIARNFVISFSWAIRWCLGKSSFSWSICGLIWIFLYPCHCWYLVHGIWAIWICTIKWSLPFVSGEMLQVVRGSSKCQIWGTILLMWKS